jgi:hypothetical protein
MEAKAQGGHGFRESSLFREADKEILEGSKKAARRHQKGKESGIVFNSTQFRWLFAVCGRNTKIGKITLVA